MYKRIVVGYDGSEQSIRALKKAVELAADWRAALEVLHVYQVPVMVVGEAMVTASADANTAIVQEAENTAEEARSIVESAIGSPGVVTVLQGDSGQQIVETAAERGADLIIVGNRGNSGIKKLLLGSVSNYIIHHAHCAVHIVK